jgi:hypothetical protein
VHTNRMKVRVGPREGSVGSLQRSPSTLSTHTQAQAHLRGLVMSDTVRQLFEESPLMSSYALHPSNLTELALIGIISCLCMHVLMRMRLFCEFACHVCGCAAGSV